MKYKIKQFLKADISKIYILGVGIICLLLIGGFFSFAMFTVNRERNNAISIITGNLTYKLEVDGVESNTTKDFTVTLSNPNNRQARFNFYYVGSLPNNVEAGYKVKNGVNNPPSSTGVNLKEDGRSSSTNTYIIRVVNNTSSSTTITLGVEVGLDYNDLSLPSNGHLFEEAPPIKIGKVSEVVLDDQGPNGDTFNDGIDTFITGTDPNNYILYSDILWRAIAVNNESKTTKLVTQDGRRTMAFDENDSNNFAGSDVEFWLNHTSTWGFLGTLDDYENYIVMDSQWDASETGGDERPDGTNIVTDAVGLLNLYEYKTCNRNDYSYYTGYLNVGTIWWTLTSYGSQYVYVIYDNGSNMGFEHDGFDIGDSPSINMVVRPSINLQENVQVISGEGTESNPYVLSLEQ